METVQVGKISHINRSTVLETALCYMEQQSDTMPADVFTLKIITCCKKKKIFYCSKTKDYQKLL